MNLQAEKIELIKLIADVESEKIIRKIRSILAPSKENLKVEYIQDDLLMRSNMIISEQVLNETWKAENDMEWAQYLKD